MRRTVGRNESVLQLVHENDWNVASRLHYTIIRVNWIITWTLHESGLDPAPFLFPAACKGRGGFSLSVVTLSAMRPWSGASRKSSSWLDQWYRLSPIAFVLQYAGLRESLDVTSRTCLHLQQNVPPLSACHQLTRTFVKDAVSWSYPGMVGACCSIICPWM